MTRTFGSQSSVVATSSGISRSSSGRLRASTAIRCPRAPAESHSKEVDDPLTRLPVARVEDLLDGKVWAAMDPRRRPSKRQKDLADIARLLEAFPALRERVPGEVLARLI
jgi:Nucleotidyl transferase AbiEii toxin, Type IV TA system